MKNLIYIFVLLVLQLSLISCNKDSLLVDPVPISSLTIVNAMAGSDPLVTDLTGADSVAAFYSLDWPVNPLVAYGSFSTYSTPSGNIPVSIYSTSDTVRPVFKSILNLENAAIYSLFICGTPQAAETLLTRDFPPYHNSADSTIGIRFVNLSAGSPVSVNVQGNAIGSAAGSIAYKTITGFKNYPAGSKTNRYIFEIRNASSGSLLSANSFEVSAFQNITIAVTGGQDPASAGPPGTILIKNY